MNPIRSSSLLALALGLSVPLAVTPAAAQEKKPATIEKKIFAGGNAPQGFSVVLVLGDTQSSTSGDNVPPAARKALGDMRDFLPYKGYRLLDVGWILGTGRSVLRLRGAGDAEYQLTLRGDGVAPGDKIRVVFQLQEPGPEPPIEPGELAARRQASAELRAKLVALQRESLAMRERLGDKNRDVQNANAEIEATKQRIAAVESAAGGRSVIDTTFNMEVGETVVVGTSGLRGGDKALIALLTAVPRGTPAKRD